MKVNNPIIAADMPDPDLLWVGDTCYMVSTTMFYVPGAPVLRSKDLCHWEIVSYIYETLEDNEIYRLENGKNAYGKGQWATSLTRHNGRFYACFVSHDCGKTYIFSTDDIEKSGWERAEIDRVFHDMSFLFWEGVPYLVYGNGEIRIVQLTEDLSGVQPGGLDRILFETSKEGMRLRCEGCRALVKNGWLYLLFIDWPAEGGRREVCCRSRSLEGPYEWTVVMDDDCGRPGCGVAQGTVTEGPDGSWYGILFQDRGASGRIPFLMPVSWEKDWPMFGEKKTEGGGAQAGCARYVPKEWEIPFSAYDAAPVVVSDSFSHTENRLALPWQWNHNPIPSCWSFTDRSGWLRLTTGHTASSLMDARNTLTQRTCEPGCICRVTLDFHGMKEGDYAGLCALQGRYGQIGVAVRDEEYLLVCRQADARGSVAETVRRIAEPAVSGETELQVLFDYREGRDQAFFSCRTDGGEWQQLGGPLDMVFTLDLFTGYRIGIFNYASKESGGYADFRDFTVQGL